MKRLLISLALLTSITSKALEQDQISHFAVGYAIGTTMSQLILSNETLREDKWAAFFIPVVVTGFAAWAHEWASFSSDADDDILWTTMGGAAGAGFSVAIDF